VKVQVNDSLVSFPEVSPFIDGNGDMQVPLRAVAEQMGYRIDWSNEGADIRLALVSNERTIRLKTGSNDADVNGKPLTMASPALFKDGHVFVPLRFISESFGYMVQWDNNNGIAIICKDGKYHSPAWWAPAPAPAPAPAQAPSPTAKVIEAAKQLEGVPYHWGGTSASGFDCSGFVNYVFDEQGIALPRTSEEMFAESGSPVSASQLKPGDLVFFTIGSIHHVGIYLGNDAFISATSSRGIHVDSLATKYWGSKYIGAKRVI
jgi:peptidoglycan endopeptidase LytE